MSESSQFHFTATGTDPICRHCGRPVIGASVWGNAGPYHPACVQPPLTLPPKHFGMTDGTFQPATDPRDAALNKAREALKSMKCEGPNDTEVCMNCGDWPHQNDCIIKEALAEIEKVGK